VCVSGLASGTLLSHWQSAAFLAGPSAPHFRCRELVQASLMAAFDKAKHELSAFRTAAATSPARPPAAPGPSDAQQPQQPQQPQHQAPPGVIVVTGSLHAVAEALKLEDLRGAADGW
jgi:hypothetical protein